MGKYYSQELYQIEKAEFIRKSQEEIWQLWFNRFMNQGILVHAAIANCEDIVRDWSGHSFNKSKLNGSVLTSEFLTGGQNATR